jgi:NADPH:quinone reductase-like Zn-dependent oxidoreductase
MDNVGTTPFTRCKASLKRGGRLLIVVASLPDMLKIPWINLTSGKKVIAGTASADAADLQFIASLVEAGEFKPAIDRRYPFEQAVAAHCYVDEGRKKGNVILTLIRNG